MILERKLDDGTRTFGVLYDRSANFICCTLERPWLGNQRQISCIPPGTYFCDGAAVSPKFGQRWVSVQKVEARTHIGIHCGNLVTDSLGCILVGQGFRDFGQGAGLGISNSRLALLDLFLARPPQNGPWTLEIREVGR